MDESKIFSDTPPPYDVIGDVHACLDELHMLFDRLEYFVSEGVYIHPAGRMPVFLGDLTDRGPDSIGVLKMVLKMVKSGKALFTPGNHDVKLERWMKGRNIRIFRGVETTVDEFSRLEERERREIITGFISLMESSPPYLILDSGNFVVSHGGIREDFIGRFDKRIGSFVLYGDTTGKYDDNGMPERRDWAERYRGEALVVYGHTPVEEIVFRNNTINIDGGCAFGGKLCALRYPEREVVCVPARRTYYARNNEKRAE